MQCPHCHAENRAGARFCGQCGEALEVQPESRHTTGVSVCPSCGSPIKPGARFCGRCGSVVGLAEGGEGSGRSEADRSEAGRSEAGRSEGQRFEAARSERGEPALVSPVVTPVAYMASEIPRQPPRAAPIPSGQGVPPQALSTTPTASRPVRRPAWLLAAVAALATGVFSLCLVVALAASPAFGRLVPAPPPVDPTRADLTIHVEEAYLSDMVGEALPDAIDGVAVLDVLPANLIIVTVDFQLLIVRLQVVVKSTIGVEEGRIRVGLESIETGGHDVLDLIGMDQLVLGDDITGAIQDALEDELGEGARLLSISTDDARVTLTARWE